ncbi:hypothetical protein MNBD_GAMMA26-429 [hydrothermal vent metagenome]|uniref:peptidylprolyl isomerase n=1 Tax=hydrothermal vent metagenome TaxID=652676 RepID=A0A3B1AL94_9ZZZZ
MQNKKDVECALVFLGFSSQGLTMQVRKDRVVTIEYTTTDNNDQVVDTTDHGEKFLFIQGRETVFKAVEEALEGHFMGELLKITLAPEQAYGLRDDALIKKVPRDHIRVPGDLKVGIKLRGSNRNNAVPITIVDFDDDTVTLDANNPLAGQILNIELAILEVRDALEEELETGNIQAKTAQGSSMVVEFGA